jgi:hypothetical protein
MAMATPEEQLGQILALLSENSKGINDLKHSMMEMRTLRTEILTWKPDVDHRIHELEHAVLDLGERIDQVLETLTPLAPPLDPSASEQQDAVTASSPPFTAAIRENHFASPSVKMPSSAHLELFPPRAASRSLDHGKLGFRAVYTIAPAQNPITGATNPPKMFLHNFKLDDTAHCERIMYSPIHTPIPNLEFPTFDGTNPRLWIKYCETFFDVYSTDPSVWVWLALLLCGTKQCNLISLKCLGTPLLPPSVTASIRMNTII